VREVGEPSNFAQLTDSLSARYSLEHPVSRLCSLLNRCGRDKWIEVPPTF
jgi:hypothetical protein